MLRISSLFVAGLLVFQLITVPATADELGTTGVEQSSSRIMTGRPVPATGFGDGLMPANNRLIWFAETEACDVGLRQSLAEFTSSGRTETDASVVPPRVYFALG